MGLATLVRHTDQVAKWEGRFLGFANAGFGSWFLVLIPNAALPLSFSNRPTYEYRLSRRVRRYLSAEQKDTSRRHRASACNKTAATRLKNVCLRGSRVAEAGDFRTTGVCEPCRADAAASAAPLTRRDSSPSSQEANILEPGTIVEGVRDRWHVLARDADE
jgi:hypothetical protein